MFFLKAIVQKEHATKPFFDSKVRYSDSLSLNPIRRNVSEIQEMSERAKWLFFVVLPVLLLMKRSRKSRYWRNRHRMR